MAFYVAKFDISHHFIMYVYVQHLNLPLPFAKDLFIQYSILVSSSAHFLQFFVIRYQELNFLFVKWLTNNEFRNFFANIDNSLVFFIV